MHQTQKQHRIWLLAALTAPLAHFSGSGWFGTMLAALAVLPLACLPADWENLGKWLSLLEILWFAAVAGTLVRNSAACWPSNNDTVVPLTLLALAAFTRPAAAPRVGAVLGLCLLVLYLPVYAAGAMQAEVEWLAPSAGEWTGGLLTALLLPALPGQGKKDWRGTVAAGMLAVSLSALVQVILSPQVARSVSDPFWQMARTLSPGGVSHIEPLIAVASMLGWYALCSLLLNTAEGMGRKTGMSGRSAKIIAAAAAAGFVLFPQQLSGSVLTVLSLFFWVLIPFCTKIICFKKSEKRS